MPRIRLRRKAIFYLFLVVCVNVILWFLLNVIHWDNHVSFRKLAINSSMKQLINKLVPEPKHVLTFEIGRPKPEGDSSFCRFTQSFGLELLAENYLYPKKDIDERKCSGETSICSVTVTQSTSHLINCEDNPCGSFVKVGTIFKETGKLQWEDVNSGRLENFIEEFVIKNLDDMYPFFMLKCKNTTDHDKTTSQTPHLVAIPLSTATNISESKKDVNINILFINAVSRRHFYRSLPKTIATFRGINLNPKSTSNVLDFELYQALGSSSMDAIMGLINGESTNLKSKSKNLLRHFKKAGYQTLWQTDKCWQSDSTFFDFFGIDKGKNDLDALKAILNNEYIDSTGVTHAGCLMKSVVPTEKMDSVEHLCINGRFQHDYLLNYVMQSLSAVTGRPSKPLFSLASLSLGEEASGSHIQLLDASLASFVSKMAADKNTITILISDHGNTFDMFPVQTMEGQYEQYNPFLFMVLPTYVAWRLGESKKKYVLNNQIKLISIYDIHNTVFSLVENPAPSNETMSNGLFEKIDVERNCTHLKLSMSSLCICDGWNSKQHPNNFHYIIAEFALGQLNNLIATQYFNQMSQDVPFKTCERLKGALLQNINQKRIQNGYIATEIDIAVQSNVLYRVNVKWHGDHNPAMEMALINYERKHNDQEHASSCSTYIDRDLCVCQSLQHASMPGKIPNWRRYGDVFQRSTRADNRHNHCLYILSREYSVSTVFEAANMCNHVTYSVKINFELENMRTPTELPVNVTIPPKSIKFLTFVMPLHLTNPGTWEYEIDFTVS